MAIYTTNNTPYKGRSLQDMLVPYLMYTQRYDDIANKMGDLGDQSVIWNNLLSPTRDPETYRMVSEYNERLGNTISDMQNGNINLNDAMNKLQNMRREYNSWGTAVDAAYKQRQKLIEEQRALALQPGGFHVTRPAESFSIDELMSNPATTYEALSENELYSRGLNAAKAASGRKFSTYQAIRFKGEYETLVNQQGYSQKDAAKFLADKYNIPELGQIFDNITTEYNLNRFGNDESIDRIQLDQAIFNGILDGMTGSRSEQMLGRHKEPQLPTNPFGGSGNNNNTSNLPSIPLSHVTQGLGKPNGSVVTDVAFMNDGRVVTTASLQNQDALNEFLPQYQQMQQEYQEAIQNGQRKVAHEGIDASFPTTYTYENIADIIYDEQGNIKPGIWWTYNGKTYRTNDLLDAQKKYKELGSPMINANEVYNQYSYLNQNQGMNLDMSPADVVNIGNQLNNSIVQQKIVDYPYKAVMSDQSNIVKYFNTILTSKNYYPDADNSQNGIFQINPNGTLSGKITNPPTDTDNAVVIAKDSGNGLQIGFRQNGHDYAWRGDAIINQVTQEYNGMKKWLQDFSNTGVGQGTPDGMMRLANTNINKDDIYFQINGKKGTAIPGTPYFGFVVYDQGSGDIIKIISDTETFILPQAQLNPLTNQYQTSYGSSVIAVNTMGSQLHGNSSYMNEFLGQYLQRTFDGINSWYKKTTE